MGDGMLGDRLVGHGPMGGEKVIALPLSTFGLWIVCSELMGVLVGGPVQGTR